jgi:tripartite-type tricarboxylate transporter receptor subunit TctC
MEIKRAVEEPDVRNKLAVLGFQPVLNTPDEFSARIRTEMAKWGKVVRDANIKIE